MATTFRELELLNPAGFTSPSSLRNFSPFHRTFSRHLHFPYPMSSTLLPPCFCLVFLPFLSLTLELKLYGNFSPCSSMSTSNNLKYGNNWWHDGYDVELPPPKPWFNSFGKLTYTTQHFYSFTILLASIFSSALST